VRVSHGMVAWPMILVKRYCIIVLCSNDEIVLSNRNVRSGAVLELVERRGRVPTVAAKFKGKTHPHKPRMGHPASVFRLTAMPPAEPSWR
jgi:hypothetical protein